MCINYNNIQLLEQYFRLAERGEDADEMRDLAEKIALVIGVEATQTYFDRITAIEKGETQPRRQSLDEQRQSTVW
jgi:hypothetical protein